MFDDLDDSIFDGVRATYGLATEAPQRFRSLASPEVAASEQALYWIEADYFHQGLYCAATPLAVPYLLEVAQLPLPVQAEVVRLLGEMLRGGADASSDIKAYAPAELDHEAVPATRAAVEAGAAGLAQLLDATDPLVRCAAMWTNAAFGPSVRARLIERMQLESDERVRISGWLALSTLGELPLARVAVAPLENDVLRVLGATSPLDGAAEDAFVRLISSRPLAWLRFFEGDLSRIGLFYLQKIGMNDPRAVSILKRVIESVESVADVDALFCQAVFPDGVPRAARDLNELQRWAYAHVWVGEARGVRLDYGCMEAQRDFLAGDGPLDDVVTLGDRTGTVAESLLAESADSALAKLADALAEDRKFQLAMTLMRGDFGYPGPLVEQVIRAFGRTITLDRTLAYLAMPDAELSEAVSRFLLSPYLEHDLPSPPSLDALAERWLGSSPATERTWLRTFSPERRVHLVASLHRMELLPLCDAQALAAEVLARYLASPDLELTPSLFEVPSTMLVACDAAPHKRAHIDSVLAERASRMEISVSARRIHTMTMEVMLPRGTRLAILDVAETRTSADLDPIRAVLRDSPNAAFTIYPTDIPGWIVDTLRAELGDRAQLPIPK